MPSRDAWPQSERSRALARKAARKAHLILAKAPRCGAKTRDGMQCQSPGVGAGGRCYRHGGATPRGDQWHRVQFGKTARSRENKLVTLRIRAEKRAAKLAAMTPEERALFEQRAKRVAPGTIKQRAARREERRQTREAGALLALFDQPRAKDAEMLALEAMRDELLRRLAAHEAEQAQNGGSEDEQE